jgi:uncharacterized protein (UPF0548 family)
VPAALPRSTRLSSAAAWPLGIALTSWHYLWRTTPVHRWELRGSLPEDGPPPLRDDVRLDEVQGVEDGTGLLFRRLYRTRIRGARVTPEELMREITPDLDALAPRAFVSFLKTAGDERRLAVGDEYLVRMPGPWDGPVRVVDVTPTSFRLVTRKGHLEAGQIEFRAAREPRVLTFSIESWARSGDRFSDLLYSRLRMAKEVQLHMWTSVIERVVKLSGGAMDGGIAVTTRRVEMPRRGRVRADRSAELARLPLNFDPARREEHVRDRGWHIDDMTTRLPGEPSGPPVPGGSWETARRLMVEYEVADPSVVRAEGGQDFALAGRSMLLEIRFAGLRFHVGVRVGDVYDETRTIEGARARVFGWDYRTLEGHFEQGQMHYEVWKWLQSGDVEFRIHAYSRVADSGPLVQRLGFRLVGRSQQLAFYRKVCRRMRRLTEAEMELQAGES